MKGYRIKEPLKGALAEAMAEEYGWVPEPEMLAAEHKFSSEFEKRMKKIFQSAEYRYVGIGRRRIRRAAALALIVALLLAMTAGAVAIQRILVTWNETQNEEAGTLDVTFSVEDPNGLAGEFRYRKPDTPAGYEIVREEKNIQFYYIEYADSEGNSISYSQQGGIETMGLSLDNEDADFHEITINGYKGYSYSKAGVNALTWTDGNTLYDIGGTCDMDLIWEMAESIK